MAEFDALWNYTDPVGTRAEFSQLLSDGIEPLDLRLELQTQLARTYSLNQEFVEAHQVLDGVEEEISAETPIAHIRYLLERGRTYRSDKQPEIAKPLFEEAFYLAKAQGEDNYAVDAAHMIALVIPPSEQHAWNLRALAIAEASQQPQARKWLGSLYNNIGWTYHDEHRYIEALETFEQGLAWQLENGSRRTIRIAHWTIGRTLRSLGRIPEALACHEALLAESISDSDSNGYIFEESAECLQLLGRHAEAQAMFAAAYAALSQDKWLVANEPERLARLLQLSASAPPPS